MSAQPTTIEPRVASTRISERPPERPPERPSERPPERPPASAPGPDRDDGHRLAGSRTLVTGGGRGIGRLVAQSFARAGADVALLARSRDELDETCSLIEDHGGRVASAVADVTDAAALADAIGELRSAVGPFDVLVNNAGITGPMGPLWTIDADDWWRTVDVNLRGLVLATQLVLPDMVARRRGRILNITSQAGAFRWPLVSAYSVSKAAVTKLTENLAHETSQFGIAVLSVHPGLLPIGMSEQAPTGEAPSASSYEQHVWSWVGREIDEGRGADPDDAVALITRLADGDGDQLTGRHLSVHDDLDDLVAHIEEIRRRDLLVMHPKR